MLIKGTVQGKPAYILGTQTLIAISEWCKSLFILVYGEEGEQRFRRLRFSDALDLWSSYRPSELN